MAKGKNSLRKTGEQHRSASFQPADFGKISLRKTGNAVLLSVGILLFLISLLTLFKAPTHELWLLAILATEYGHGFALLSLLVAYLLFRGNGRRRAFALLPVIAAVLYLTPLFRALPVAVELPNQITRAFGEFHNPEAETAYGRTAPISVVDLFTGLSRPDIHPERFVYKTVAEQSLAMDVYRPPQGQGPFPCVVVIHGGAWRSGSTRQLYELNQYLAGRGYVVAAITYRLAPRWRFPAQIEDVRDAIQFVQAHADTLNIDPQRLVLLGRSAGAHLALLAGYTANDPAIRGVVSFYGPPDLVYGWNHPANPRVINTHKVLRDFIGGSPDELPEPYRQASPIHFVNPLTPPTLLIHGTRDELVRIQQSRQLAVKLAEQRVRHVFIELPYATHGCDFRLAGPSGQISTYAIERFLAAVMQ